MNIDMNEWDNLPNAKHIDRVLASLKANPEKWNAVLDEVWSASYDIAWCASYNIAWDVVDRSARALARNAAYNAAYQAARGETRSDGRRAARRTILGLVAYDNCAHLLDSTPDELLILHTLGDERAALFIPAAKVFSEEKIT